MTYIFLQLWGGVFYLANKILFAIFERSNSAQIKTYSRILAWLVYIIALPAWVTVFYLENNWIAAAIEAGAAPAMLVGLIVAIRGRGSVPKFLSKISLVAVIVGTSLSLYNFGGINSISQILEFGIAIGFLLGTYELSKEQPQGYLWLILGNLCCSLLMVKEGYYILMLQQLVSLLFVLDAYYSSR